ncbi:two-partner secretion domain-containing protein, partial [Acinetobacter stercoris]|uniref:two-partner secretion domain-containing protein n=1 Tax=Acinetobacter stercoris TaxID=2126983 RepID=UPI000EFD2EED
MNKNRYRIIFSKAKNMFIAVAENIKSQSKTSGQTVATNLSVETDSTSFHQLWQVKSIVASMSLFMAFSPVYANIQVDPGAAAANRAVVGVGKNAQGQNVPVVNIQTAKNGISHNVYKQFDVLQPGVVLNNSRGGAKSVIVGNVAANPFLNTGEARVILNEVNSTAATQFLGNLEVAGQRADVIIANPSGIVVNGGGFINANKGILTTGKPQMNADGSLKQFVVDQGKVTINGGANNLGLGGNNNNAEFVDIYARALEMNAQLHAKQGINVITGANTISADLENVTDKTSTAAKPALAVDVKALGGMYANNIFIMGTEKGLGVSNAGTLRAVNNLVVTSAGQVQHSGTMESTSPTQGMLNIQTTGTGAEANITSSGLISSKGLLNINSGSDLNITAKEVKVDVGTVSPLILSAKGNLNIAAKANVRNFSTDKGDIYLDGKNITVGAGALIGGNGSVNLNATDGNVLINKTSSLSARYDLGIQAKDSINIDASSIWATKGDVNLISLGTKDTSFLNITNTKLSSGKDFNISGANNVKLNSSIVQESSSNINLYANNNLDIGDDINKVNF